MLRAREPSIIKFKTLTNNNRQTKLLKQLAKKQKHRQFNQTKGFKLG
ncbi:MAG: hypothetical protein ACI8RD_011951 [Bacillariaceae sp.]|jgi:hypothetical protein